MGRKAVPKPAPRARGGGGAAPGGGAGAGGGNGGTSGTAGGGSMALRTRSHDKRPAAQQGGTGGKAKGQRTRSTSGSQADVVAPDALVLGERLGEGLCGIVSCGRCASAAGTGGCCGAAMLAISLEPEASTLAKSSCRGLGFVGQARVWVEGSWASVRA